MAKIGVPKQSLEGRPPLPVGVYEFRLDGFEPAFAKEKPGKDRSYNLNPKLVVINHPTLNDSRIFSNCNSAYPPEMFDMAHALGVKFEGEDDPSNQNPEFPGEFMPTGEPDPTKWQYVGPLLGQTGKVEMAESVYNGKTSVKIKRFFCKIPGCQARHKESLL